ncbi:MAG: cell envelope integrity protein TolA [Bdellovibrionales bacterium]
MADQSFRTLIYSLVVHGILAWVLLHLPSQNETRPLNQPVEFTVQEGRKHKAFVTETDKKEELLEDLKKKADYLSQFTKRVKEQVLAQNSGATKNRTGKAPIESDEMRAKGQNGDGAQAQKQSPLQANQEQGAKAGSQSGANPFGKNVVVGASTAGEYIPGVKQGSFTALNTDRFTYYTFFARINEQVRSRWIQNLRIMTQSLSQSQNEAMASRERITDVDIQLDRAGQFVRAVVMHSSGYKELDRAATEAFREAAPFANPPQAMIESDGLIHLRYGFILQLSPNQVQVGR